MIGLLPAENWEYKITDIIHGLTSILDSRERIVSIDIAGIGSCVPVRSGRLAIVLAIKALNLPLGSCIGVPLYSCPVVFKAIKAAGCKACFIDIEPDTFCISPKDLFLKRDRVDAVIAIHMFGNLCDMPRLLEVAKGKPIIEDCAQSLGSKLNNRMSGLFGTISIFSFRSGKYLSVGEGGALFSSHEDIRSRITHLISAMPVPGKLEEFIHIIKMYVRSSLRSQPLYGIIGYSLWKIYNKKVSFTTKMPIIFGKIYRSDYAIIRQRLEFIDFAIEKQRANAEYYSHNLNLNYDMLCHEKPDTFYNRYLYPITLPSSKHRDLMAEYLHRKKIDTIKPYQDIVEIASNYYEYAGDCPVAEKIARRVLIIPSHYRLRKVDVQYIAKSLNESWAEIKSK